MREIQVREGIQEEIDSRTLKKLNHEKHIFFSKKEEETERKKTEESEEGNKRRRLF